MLNLIRRINIELEIRVFFFVSGNIAIIDMESIVYKIINIVLLISVIILIITRVVQFLGTIFKRYAMSIIVFIFIFSKDIVRIALATLISELSYFGF